MRGSTLWMTQCPVGAHRSLATLRAFTLHKTVGSPRHPRAVWVLAKGRLPADPGGRHRATRRPWALLLPPPTLGSSSSGATRGTSHAGDPSPSADSVPLLQLRTQQSCLWGKGPALTPAPAGVPGSLSRTQQRPGCRAACWRLPLTHSGVLFLWGRRVYPRATVWLPRKMLIKNSTSLLEAERLCPGGQSHPPRG